MLPGSDPLNIIGMLEPAIVQGMYIFKQPGVGKLNIFKFDLKGVFVN